MTQDEKYIRRCIQLAQNGLCTTAPNPMVGAVIVYNDRIIGEGYHIRSGEGHAEVNAIRSVKDESLLSKATIYVSLEPCSHHGKTPPCADLIISKRIPRVVIGCADPFPLVAGRGIRKLQEAGISVTVGVLEQECKELIRRFTTYHLKKRPYITLKWAESADGFIDIIRQDGKPVILSTPLTALHAHKLRAENQAILVGRKTALLDNPSLSTRHWYGRHPLRLVIDKDLNLPSGLHLFDGSLPTVVFTSRQKESSNNLEYKTLDFNRDILPQIIQVLYEKKIQTLLVEGGSQLLQSFLTSGLWDEACVEHSQTLLKEGVAAPFLSPQYSRKEFQYDGVRLDYYVK